MDPASKHWLERIRKVVTFLLKRTEDNYGRLSRHRLFNKNNCALLSSLVEKVYPDFNWRTYLNRYTGLKLHGVTTELTAQLHLIHRNPTSKNEYLIPPAEKIEPQTDEWIFNLTFVAVFKDEGERIEEWLDFHIEMGVEHFLLYDNESSDSFREKLNPYISSGYVTLRTAPNLPGDKNFESAMLRAYEDARVSLRDISKWVLYLDLDEFVFTTTSTPLPDYLAKFQEYPGLSVSWVNFGTSGVQELQAGDMQTLKVIHRFPDEHFHNYHVKTFLQLRFVERCGLHNAKMKGQLVSVDPKYNPIPNNLNLFRPTDEIRINHYWMRSEGNRERKFQRVTYQYYSTLTPEQRDKIHWDRNNLIDTTIVPLVSKMLNKRVKAAPHRTLILHVGLHKTGTSAIQLALQTNFEKLQKYSYYFFQSAKMPDHSNNWLGISLSDLEDRKFKSKRDLDYHLGNLQRELDESDFKNYILSAETLAVFSSRIVFSQVAKFISKNFDRLKIVIFIRRQDRHLQSVYQHWIRAGKADCSIREFIPYYNDDFLKTTREWKSRFPHAELELALFDNPTLPNNSIICDFLFRIGLKDLSEFNLNVPRVNSAFNLSTIELLRFIRKSFSDISIGSVTNLIVDKVGDSSSAFTTVESFLDPQSSSHLMHSFHERNCELFREFLPSLPATFYSDSAEAEAMKWERPIVSESLVSDLIQIIGEQIPVISSVKPSDVVKMHRADYSDWYRED